VPQDIYDVAPEVLRHRVMLSYDALAAGITVEGVLNRILSTVVAPTVRPGTDAANPLIVAAG
jgi:MoxR-like ATPase